MAPSSLSLCDDVLLLITEHYIDSLLDAYLEAKQYFAADAVTDLRNYMEVFSHMSRFLYNSLDVRLSMQEEKNTMYERVHRDKMRNSESESWRKEYRMLCCLSYVKWHLRDHTLSRRKVLLE